MEEAVTNTQATNPYVFIVGTPRSGTTLLKRMIDAHPEIAVTRETHWIPKYYRRRIGVTKKGLIGEDLVERLFEHSRFGHLKLKRAEVERLLEPSKSMLYADFVSRLFDLYAARNGKSLAGDKTPPYVRHIGLLHSLWPSARFIHIIRDGRDVCLSMLNWRMAHRAAGRRAGWEQDPVTTTALWWRWLVELGREAGSELPERLYYQLPYEDLVSDPEGRSREICRFLDLGYDDVMLAYNEGRQKNDPGLSANRAWLPPTPGLRDWRSQMAAEDVERFEAAAGDLLEELGYERQVAKPSGQALAHAERMHELFDGSPLPKNW